MSKFVWVLEVEDRCSTQCTGFDSQTSTLCIFDHKPEMTELAKMVGHFLSDDMGEAISQVNDILNGVTLEQGYEWVRLVKVSLNERLESE